MPFASERFDFATAFMSLMDMPGPEAALREAWRVLRSGGFLQFSITHPCFFPPHRRQLRNERGEPYAVELGRYFDRIDGEIDRWTFSAAPPETGRTYLPFEIPRFHRTLSKKLIRNTIWVRLMVVLCRTPPSELSIACLAPHEFDQALRYAVYAATPANSQDD